MELAVKGIGAWGGGFHNWGELAARFAASQDHNDWVWTAPAPTQIPQRERRRAPLLVKLAVEVAHQACEAAGLDKSEVPSVFCSGMGDSEITNYMCSALAGPSKVLSPTKFHNSVHNAPAGYWSISAENRAPNSSVANGRETFSTALLEAAVLAVTEHQPVLLVAADIEVTGVLDDVFPIAPSFAAAMVLEPATHVSPIGALTVRYSNAVAAWPTVAQPSLQDISAGNPSARCLVLLEALAVGQSRSVSLPISEAACLQVDVVGARSE